MPDRFNYPPADLLNPVGRNGMSTRAAYYQRSLYKDKIYPAEFPSPIDIWYDKVLFGRIDRFQNSVVPDTQNLKMIPSSGIPNLMALNVVVDVFERFVKHMAKAVLVSVVDKTANPNLLDLKAIRAYQSPNARYAQFTQGIFDTFANNLTGKEKGKIVDFGSFLKFYRNYLLMIAASTPVTKTNYLISQNGSIYTGGISIAIANEDAGSDAVKYEKFITDPNFEFYRKCAKKFGFMIDKNAPWVLTADMFSTAFEQAALGDYVTSDGKAIDRTNFFDVFYNKTCHTDFTDLMYLFINSYISLVNRDPYYDHQGAATSARGIPGTSVETLGGGCPVVAKLRAPLVAPDQTQVQIPTGTSDSDSNKEAADASPSPAAPTDIRAQFTAAHVMSDQFLIDFYIDLRQIEIGSPLSGLEVASLKRQAYEVYQVQPQPHLTKLQNVGEFVNTIYRNYIYDFGAVALQIRNAKLLDNRVSGGRILVENDIIRQLY